MNINKKIKEMVKDRNYVLTKLEDPTSILDITYYCKKYKIKMPDNVLIIYAGFHKARLYVTSPEITEDMKEKSRKWLKDNGFTEEI